MTDLRPQYGEYATPEEQRRAAGLPPVEEPVATGTPMVAGARSDASAGVDAVIARPIDRFATIALLAYGLITVVMTGLSYLELSTVMNEALRLLGAEGEFSNFDVARSWGIVAAVVLVLGWSFTAAVSFQRLRRGRIAWWVPVVGAVLTMLIVSVCLTVPMLGDPAFIAYLESTRL